MDAGIASGENLELLRELQYNYICVSRKRLTGHEPADDPSPVIVRDRPKQPIELLSVDPAGDNGGDRFVQVRSRMKALNETAGRFPLRTETDKNQGIAYQKRRDKAGGEGQPAYREDTAKVPVGSIQLCG